MHRIVCSLVVRPRKVLTTAAKRARLTLALRKPVSPRIPCCRVHPAGGGLPSQILTPPGPAPADALRPVKFAPRAQPAVTAQHFYNSLDKWVYCGGDHGLKNRRFGAHAGQRRRHPSWNHKDSATVAGRREMSAHDESSYETVHSLYLSDFEYLNLTNSQAKEPS